MTRAATVSIISGRPSFEIGFWPTETPGVWIGALEVKDESGRGATVAEYVPIQDWRICQGSIAGVGPVYDVYDYHVGLKMPGFLQPKNWLKAAKKLAKPAVYAVGVMTGGLPGLAAAWAADKTGVLDALAKLIEKAGKILLDVVASKWFAALCSSVATLVGVPEVGIGCIIVSVASEVAAAIAKKEWHRIVSAAARLTNAMLDAIKIEDMVDGLIGAILTFPGLDVQAFATQGLDSIRAGLGERLRDEVLVKIDRKIAEVRKDLPAKVNEATRQAVKVAEAKLLPQTPGNIDRRTSDPNAMPHGPLDQAAYSSFNLEKILTAEIPPGTQAAVLWPLERGVA